MNNANARGFTLIELVVVIALLGILAAFAIPRFASLESEARAATIQGLAGSLRSASAMAHGLHLATGSDPVTMEGVAVDIVNGYPTSDAVQNSLADLTGFDVNLATPAAGSTTFDKTGTTSGCSVVYTEAPSGGAPTVVANTGSC
ncbi:MAG: prepilin-type N-terminal cleavage/methylation domain-containing protein [Woeseia sp.]